jgi:hypothetical protein
MHGRPSVDGRTVHAKLNCFGQFEFADGVFGSAPPPPCGGRCFNSDRAACRDRTRLLCVTSAIQLHPRAGVVLSRSRHQKLVGLSLAISVAAYGREQSADQDDVMVDDHPQRMHRHRF